MCENNLINWFNSWHSNIKFDVSNVSLDELNFLDVKVIFSSGTFRTTIYRKPQNPLKVLNYNSFVPFKYKKNMVSSILYRIKRICSDLELYEQEKKVFKDILFSSGYKKFLADRLIKIAEDNMNRLKVFGPLKKPIYFGLEYFGKSSENFEKVVRSVTRKLTLPSQKIIFYYKRGKSLENLFSQKFKNFGPDNGLNGVYKIIVNIVSKTI